MARLLTTGAEIDVKELGILINGAVTRDTTVFASGLASWKCDSGVGNATAKVQPQIPTTGGTNTSFWIRGRYYFVDFPTADTTIMEDVVAASWRVNITSSGGLKLIDGNGSQIGSTSNPLNLNTFYRIEVSLATAAVSNTIAANSLELRIESVSVAGPGGAANGAAFSGGVEFGWLAPPGASKVCHVDDIAINDSTGADQNSWPGEGKIILLKPISDGTKGGGWTNDAAGTTNFFDAVDNAPPTGIADTTSGSGLHQIRNAGAFANSDYQGTTQTYAAAGLGSVDTITVIDPIVATAAPVSTSAKQGTIGVTGNPSIGPVALGAGGTAGAFWSGTAAGTYPTGWKWSHGTITYNPTVTKGSAASPVVSQVTSSTRIAMVCFMGMYVEYVPHNKPGWFVRSDARHRSHNW